MWRTLWWWFLYALVWPGLNRRGHPITGDVLLVQAFGRRVMPDQEAFTVHQLLVEHDFCDAEVFRELRQRSTWFDPGPQNRQLAAEVVRVMTDYAVPVIGQWETIAALPMDFYLANQARIITIWPKAGRDDYLSTRDVLSFSQRYCERHGFRSPVILAHRRMMLRVMFMWRKMTGSFPILYPTEVSGFDPASSQPHTRSLLVWTPREAFARWVHHPLKGWV